MALKALDIFKLLPKTNCQKCGSPTCLAFAMKLAAKQATLDLCPDVTAEAKAALEGSAAPPIRLVAIGAGPSKLEIGNETVMFRHDESFYHPPGIGVIVPDDLDDAALAARVAAIGKLSFVRVGVNIRSRRGRGRERQRQHGRLRQGGHGSGGARPADRPGRHRARSHRQGARDLRPASAAHPRGQPVELGGHVRARQRKRLSPGSGGAGPRPVGDPYGEDQGRRRRRLGARPDRRDTLGHAAGAHGRSAAGAQEEGARPGLPLHDRSLAAPTSWRIWPRAVRTWPSTRASS